MTRTALVTGAARGIGAATCRLLASQGYAVVAVDRASDDDRLPYAMGTPTELEQVVADCQQSGTAAVGVIADTCDESGLDEAIEAAHLVGGGLDVAIAAAGVAGGGAPTWEVDAATQQAVLDVNLHGVIALARVAVPAMLRRDEPRDGRFLAVASVAAHRGLPKMAAYCAAKAGVLGLVRALAVELAGTGITAASVSPGSTDTAILTESARLYGLEDEAAFVPQQPIGRLLRPEEVAATLAHLCGPAGAVVTGSDVVVDGGLAL